MVGRFPSLSELLALATEKKYSLGPIWDELLDIARTIDPVEGERKSAKLLKRVKADIASQEETQA